MDLTNVARLLWVSAQYLFCVTVSLGVAAVVWLWLYHYYRGD